MASDIGGYEHAVLFSVSPDGCHARLQFSAGIDREFPHPPEIPIGDGSEPDTTLTGRALHTGQLGVCTDLTPSEAPVATRERLVALGYKSVVALPLSVEGRRIAVLSLASKDAALLCEEELLLLQDVSSTLSTALEAQTQAVTAQFLAYFDPLTGLAKRTLFCERLEQVLHWRIGPRDVPAVAVFDVRHLSNINDGFGRHFGDLVLQRVSERLKAHAGSDERLGYLGAGTFALIEPQLGDTEGEIAALLDGSVFGEPFAIEGRSLRLSYRLGIARLPVDGPDGNTLVQRAEAALKRAKESGERYLHYQLQMHSETFERLELEHRLRAALEQQQFELHYQPQVSLQTGCIESVEALLRWNDPERGMILPGSFLSVLEATGLIVPVGHWILGQCVTDCEYWASFGLPKLRVAVNVSALQLRRKTFVPTVLELNDRLSARCGWGLDLEITESIVLQDLENTSRKLHQLRAAGVRFALDDFGTGYSALGLLSKLPVDVVKIDRSFVGGLPTDTPGALLTESIIRLATALGFVTVAEGVETEAERAALRAMGCHCWQGYLHSRPMSRAELLKQFPLQPVVTRSNEPGEGDRSD